MASGELLERIKAFAERFAEQSLAPYLARLARPGEIGGGSKEINDAVWGTVKVSPLEVVVIDSPLVQRLRLVRQLGVVHWVYPGASHSRFEHTLGVLHQAQRLITAINQASGGRESPPIGAQQEQLVRLCALVHDIGHGVFSHVSEHALARRTDLRLALAEFADSIGVDKVQLSELIAHDIVGSTAFRKMLELAFDRLTHPLSYGGGSAGSAQQVATLIQKAIVGHRIDERVPLLHEIITGPFDADKLDYYVRDAHHAGVPTVVDISRLLQKIVHRRTPMRDVPDVIKKALPDGQDSCELFGLKASGAAMLDELHLARVLLYAKIYRQKKVLAIEAMVDALFGALGSLPDIDPVKLIELCYRFSDDQLVVSTSADVLRSIGVNDAPENVAAFVDDLLARLRDRNLYVNSLALLAKYPDDPWASDKPQERGLQDLEGDCANPQRAAELQKAIAEELDQLTTLLPDAVEGVPAGTLKMSMVISAKPKLSGGTEIDRALILQGDRFVRGRDMDRMNQSAWVDAYHFGQPHSHVFAPKEASVATYVASERLIRARYGAVLPPSAIGLSKQDAIAVTELKRKLERAGWYSGVPMDIRPQPSRLSRADITDRVQELAVRLETIDEPRGETAPRRAPAMADRIKSWLAQFREDAAIEGALEALERMRILSREDSQVALRTFAEQHSQFKGATIVPLGDLKDSGAVQAYLSRDLETIFPRVATVAEAAESGSDKPIVFVDDFVGSGSQVRNMIGTWFDDAELRQEQLGEIRLPFQAREREFLTDRPVGFAFVAGWDDGLTAVQEAASKVGMQATVRAHIPESDIPFAFTSMNRSESSLAFEKAARKVGEALLASKRKSEEKQSERALGYGNRAMLLATRLNVPTQTLTCIWMDGMHDRVDWHALIRRRGKH
jgi:HD superfamily phosphohydrolase